MATTNTTEQINEQLKFRLNVKKKNNNITL